MTHKAKIIVDPNFRTMDEVFSPADKARLYDLAEVIWGRDEPMPEADFLAALPDADAVICADWRYGDVLQHTSQLRAILSVSGAFPLHLDYQYCHQNYIRVLSSAPSFARQVAEMCLAMALDASREVSLGDRAMRRGDEVYTHAGNRNTFMLFDQPVGFIGYGSIARALQPLLAPFTRDISAYDPWLGDGFLERHGVKPSSLEAIMRDSKVVFVLAVPSKDNQAMISREYLEMLQENSVFVLMSRAHVVDFDAMTELLHQGRFKAAIDVFPTEPLDADHPIRRAEHAVLSAHRAGSVKEGLWEIGEMVVDDLEVVLRGLPPRRLQNAEPELALRYEVNTAKKPKN
ncbi:MAG: NAD(P)-dependent oxidoreductase [Phototrophicaceae bacterium]